MKTLIKDVLTSAIVVAFALLGGGYQAITPQAANANHGGGSFSATVTSPDEGEVSGDITLEAEYSGPHDNNDSEIAFAVRSGQCDNEGDTVFGNVDGEDDDFTHDSATEDSIGIFSANFDTTTISDGDYCFTFNAEDDEDSDVQDQVNFTIAQEDDEEQDEPVSPILECVAEGNLENNTDEDDYVAHFGYENQNDSTTTIPVGEDNRFNRDDQNQGQTTEFLPGRSDWAPNNAFNVEFDGDELVWTLTGPDGETSTATASDNEAQRCDFEDEATASIDKPQDGETVSGITTLEATYNDGNDENEGVSFAVKTGTCEMNQEEENGGETVFGNVEDRNDPYNFDGQDFFAEFNTSDEENGNYCFIFNPEEGEDVDENVRLTQDFEIFNEGPGDEPLDQCSAVSVESFSQGQNVNGNDVLLARSDETKALGEEDMEDRGENANKPPYDDASEVDYVSLGFGGSITLEFDSDIPTQSGDDLRIYETSYPEDPNDPTESEYPETAEVEVSSDGDNFESVGTVTLDGTVDIGDREDVQYVRITDISDSDDFGNAEHVDGFDVAGVEAIHCGDDIEEPEIGQCEAGDILHLSAGPAEQENDGNLYRVDPATGSSTLLESYGGEEFHSSVATDENGNLFSIDSDTNDLVELEDDGTITTVGSTTGLDRPVAMVYASDQDVFYVLDQNTDNLYEIDPSNGSTTQLHSFTNLDVQGGDLEIADDGHLIYVQSAGTVYHINDSNYNVTTEGTLSETAHISSVAKVGNTYYALDRTTDDSSVADDDYYTFTLDPFTSTQETDSGPFFYGDATRCVTDDGDDDEGEGVITGIKFEDENRDGVMNDGEDGIAGFEILALGDETTNLVDEFEVAADDEDGVTTDELTPGRDYVVEVEGTYAYQDNNDTFDGNEDNVADAEYYSTSNFSAGSELDFGDNPNRDDRTLDLVINDQDVNWGEYSGNNHTYRIIDSAGSSSANFRIFEESEQAYEDNTGSLTVRIYDVTNYSTTTANDGSYTLDVPAGDYDVIEVNQPDAYEQTFPDNGVHENVSVTEIGAVSDINFGNDDIEDEINGDNSDDGNGVGGGGALAPRDDDDFGVGGGDVIPDDGDVAGDQDEDDDGLTDTELRQLLDQARSDLMSLLDSLAIIDGMPNVGDGSLSGLSR